MEKKMTTQSGFTKVAVRREEGYPIGSPAPLYIICLCGKKHTVSHPDGTPCSFIKCACGMEYDHAGWIIAKPICTAVECYCGKHNRTPEAR